MGSAAVMMPLAPHSCCGHSGAWGWPQHSTGKARCRGSNNTRGQRGTRGQRTKKAPEAKAPTPMQWGRHVH